MLCSYLAQEHQHQHTWLTKSLPGALRAPTLPEAKTAPGRGQQETPRRGSRIPPEHISHSLNATHGAAIPRILFPSQDAAPHRPTRAAELPRPSKEQKKVRHAGGQYAFCRDLCTPVCSQAEVRAVQPQR